MTNLRVIDDDRDEISVMSDGKQVRGWSYADETERRVKMLCAREFVEGFYHELAANRELVEALEAIATYPSKKVKRRTKDGYPGEIIFDEFAYKRMVDTYRDTASKALSRARGAAQ